MCSFVHGNDQVDDGVIFATRILQNTWAAVGNQSSLRVRHRATTHPITPARTQRPAHEGPIHPCAYPIRPGLSLSFTDPRIRPRTARSAHALVRPHLTAQIRPARVS
ncbi:hypothetical protein PAXINDRAFT_21353 [Paxillus involutus ATCC 200175]|uniref:Uncharacterized protein n=1 Tax=Paxillus involutus ATCC 200175 TaxID=664439 RepID=A0A0C9TAY1_PAXIN|nr:hypothetical protein PAXINDRAFT_21353 [Paxillus involutus ATCC 200175]